jgi:hypothetical protein
MYQETEYDNSFEVGTSFTLRGNSSVFNHMYEYARRFKAPPLHYANIRLGRTKCNEVYDKFLVELQAAFPGCQIERRRTVDISIHDDPKGQSMDSFTSRGEIIVVEGATVSIYCYRGFGTTFTAEMFAGSDEEYETLQAIATRMANGYQRITDTPLNKFYMITHDGQSLDLIEYSINKDKFAGFDIELQYNEDFKDVATHIEGTLSKRDGTTGIALLHGCPGSGKTTYLRYLISVLPKRIIYMPPDMANQLGTPAFFNFIRQYPNSILIIEDGENILKKRMDGEGTAPAISNLLNLSDGIMGDALNIQILCTFNADIAEIDEALLRPGRLIANHYFGVLTADKTKALVQHLYGEEAEPKNAEMTVAEIYKMNEIHASSEPQKKKNRIGFLP